MTVADVVQYLTCPVCHQDLHIAEQSLRCPNRHTYDIAKQGYVNLLGATTGITDTAEMVAARGHFLRAGHYTPLAEAIAAHCATTTGLILDIGAGTGYYLAAALDTAPQARGLATDTAKYALRKAARAHPRAAAIAWDTWKPLPIHTGSASVILNVFAPRNAPEFRRVLRADGILITITPAAQHLTELITTLGLLTVDQRKDERLDTTLAPHFHPPNRTTITYPMSLNAADTEAAVRMGPSAHHLDPDDLRHRISTDLPDPTTTTAAFTLSIYQPR